MNSLSNRGCLALPSLAVFGLAMLGAATFGATAAAADTGQLVGLGNKCIDVFQSNTEDGAPVVLWECTGNPNQIWTLDGEGITTHVVGLANKCLVPGPVGPSGHPEAVLGACGTMGSAFTLDGGLGGTFKLVQDSSGLCLDVLGSSTENGTPLIFFRCEDQANQDWRLVGNATLPAFFVPFVSLDVFNSSGRTTLFAVRNGADDSVLVRYEYFGVTDGPGEAEVTQERMLSPGAVRTVDVRQVDGTDRFTGWVGLTALDAGTGQPLVRQELYGDYFQLNRRQNFASGDRLISQDSLCSTWHLRFFNGGDFSGGTSLRYFVPEFQGAGWAADLRVYDQEGNLVLADVFSSSQHVTDRTSFSFPAAFGVVEIALRDGVKGYVHGVHDALGRFSVGLEAECRD